ncbi:MAG: hypothetical protein J6D01_00565 [Muribaculaceae bacterium]|nr:hypothetical protein [Muribaculaceae bacterium]
MTTRLAIFTAKYSLSALLPALVSAAMLTGCYTATHTAPIGQNEVKKEGAYAPSPARQLMATVSSQAPSAWQSGKRWSITDDRLKVLLNAVDGTIPETLASGALVYDSMITGSNIVGNEYTDIIFMLESPSGNIANPHVRVSYRMDSPLDSVLTKPSLPIPFTIESSIINDADSLLRGRKLYVMTSTWLDDSGNYIKRRRFLPVTVTAVSAGTPQAPLLVSFHLEEDPTVMGNLMLTLPSRPDADGPRDFASMFSLSNPRETYKSIYPDIWELITRGQVTEGMTREECRLSLGNPMEIKRQEMYGYTRETWLYEAGTYLVFEDGILKTSRL